MTIPAAVSGVLAEFTAGRAALAAGLTIEPLEGGTVNRSFRVRAPGTDWAVRLAGAADDTFRINRVAERQVHEAAAHFGFAPAIVYARPATGALVTDFVIGRTPAAAEMASAEMLAALGARLGELHAVPPPRGVRRLDVTDVLAHYLEMRDVAPGPVPRDVLAARLRWALAHDRSVPPALCHNDLHHQNLLVAGELLFVDWEYGGVGDPRLDLAAVIGYHDLNAAAQGALLAAHGRGFGVEDVASMCLVFDCLHALWLDAAGAWPALAAERRAALLARLGVDPAEREV